MMNLVEVLQKTLDPRLKMSRMTERDVGLRYANPTYGLKELSDGGAKSTKIYKSILNKVIHLLIINFPIHMDQQVSETSHMLKSFR